MKIKCTLSFSRENSKSYEITKKETSSKMDTTAEFAMLENIFKLLSILVTCHFLEFFNIYCSNIHFASAYFAEWFLVLEK